MFSKIPNHETVLIMNNTKRVRIIGAPFEYGKDSQLYSDAPNVLRNSGLYRALEVAGLSYEDRGDIKIGDVSTNGSSPKTRFKYVKEIIEISKLIAKEVKTALSTGEVPVILGGDHSIAIGSLLGIASCRKDVSLVWIDTHGDFHTSKTTPSGRLHGMSLALGLGLDKKFSKLCGLGVNFFDKRKAILFGAQKFDPGERETIVKNISLIEMSFIVHHGIGKAVEKLLNRLDTKDVHISLDLDSVDREYAPGTDMAINGALTYRELMYALERLSENHNIISMDVVELSPKNDVEGKTTSLAIESITASIGKRVGGYEMYMDRIDPINN